MLNLFRNSAPFTPPLVALLAVFAVLILASCATEAVPSEALQAVKSAAATSEEAIVFEAQNSEPVSAFRGTLQVPENRARADSRMITLTYVRFPATSSANSSAGGSPIIYLAGGPGGSGIETAKGSRFALFMAMREFGDVIAFDQRGTGASNDLPNCVSSQVDPDTTPISDAEIVELYKRAALECLSFWKDADIDIYGYTTQQSVDDLDDLRQHLGAEKISLWGISYGSHLALAALKEMDDRIDRVVLASVEGLDQTVKYPAQTDLYIGRLQSVIDNVPEMKMAMPDIAAMIRRVHARLDADPIMLDVPLRAGGTAPFLLERRDMQQLASGMIADPQWALMAMGIYAELDRGGVSGITSVMARFIEPDAPITLRPMTFAMDIASGISAARKVEVAAQAKTSLFADFLNFPMPQLDRFVPGLDLGDQFREPPQSDVPTLVLSGTLDGRTYPESQREAVAGLSDLQIVMIENAGHNLFMTAPAVTERIQQFMRGETSSVEHIRVEIPG